MIFALRKIVCVILFTALTSILAVAATDGDYLDLLDQENKVFAASRYVQTLADTPANVTVIGHDDIARFGYRTVADVLGSLSGTYNASSQWPAMGMRGVAVPGDFGSRILYLINGMPVYDPTYGGFFLEYLDIASIDRIEVVRGSGSALYGSGAVMGIINLVTRSGRDRPGNTAIAEAGSNNTYSVYGSSAGMIKGDLDAFASASYNSSKGRDIYLSERGGTSSGNDGLKNFRAFGRISNERFWFQAAFVDGAKHDPLASYGTVFNSDKLLLRERFGSVEAGFNKKLANTALVTSRVYAFDVSERGDYPYDDPTNYINVTDLKSQTYGLELRYDQFMSERHHLLSGLEVKHILGHYEVGDQPGLSRAGVVDAQGNPTYNQYGMFIQDEWRLDVKSTFFLGARYDYYDGFSQGVKSHFSPRIAYVHDLGGGNTGKLVLSEAYRAPTIYESLYTDAAPTGSVTLWRNPNLRPEITRTFEVIWESEWRKGLNTSLSPYFIQMRGTPEQVPVDTFNGQTCLILGDCNQYQNSPGKHQVIGIEGAGKWKRDDGLTTYVSATLQKSVMNARSAEMPSSPRYLLKGGVSYPTFWIGWNVSAEMQLVGATYGLSNEDGTRSASTPAYSLVNAGLNTARLGNGWRTSLRINNLFDKQTYTVASRELHPIERVPAPGRMISLQLAKDF